MAATPTGVAAMESQIMATLDPTSVLGNLRGAWAGGIISSNNTSWYVRTWRTPLTPATYYQLELRAALATCATLWNSLNDTEKNAWKSAADLPDWQKADWFGNPKNPTGYGLFVRLNVILVLAELNPITTPPAPTFPTCPAITNAFLYRTNGTAYGRADLADPLPVDANNILTWISPGTAGGTQPAKIKRRLDYIKANETHQYATIWNRAALQYGLPYLGQAWSVYVACFDDYGRMSLPVTTTVTTSEP